MKPLRYTTFIVLLLSIIFLALSTVNGIRRTDYTLPIIEVPNEPLQISAEKLNSAEVLTGVTAWDDKDGDLTAHAMVQKVVHQQGQKFEVQYAVVDSDNHVAFVSRTVECPDYVSPRFSLTEPLCYSASSLIQVRGRLTAYDLMDGDISDRIKVNANDLTPRYEGVYPVTFEVANSLGDVSRVTLDVTIVSSAKREPDIALSEYLVYGEWNESFDAMRYLDAVNGGNPEQVSVVLPEGGFQTGLNKVVFTYTGTDAELDDTTLYVVME